MRRAGYDPKEYPHDKFKQDAVKYGPRLTTEGFMEGAMTMMSAILQYLHRRTWTVLISERPGESFVVSDHPVVLEWSDPRGKKFPPGHAHVDTELTFPLSSHLALIGCYTPFEVGPLYMPAYVSGVNSRTINLSRVFVAARESTFILQRDGEIITSERFVKELNS